VNRSKRRPWRTRRQSSGIRRPATGHRRRHDHPDRRVEPCYLPSAASGSATYEFGDLDKAEYAAKRESIDAELDRLAPGPTPDLDGARAVLEDFGRFWKDETDPEPRRELVQQLFQRVWVDGQKIVAVRPTRASAGLFTSPPATSPPQETAGALSGSDGGKTRVLHPSGIEIRIG
jgi:hypothetical protein